MIGGRLSALAVCLALITALMAPEAVAQAPAVPGFDARDLSGVWQTEGAQGRGNPQSQWSANPLPFNAEGLARFEANKPGKGPRLVPPALGNDPIGHANPPGLYRTLIYPRPFEIIQAQDKIVQVFELSRVWRAIYTDGRPVPDEVPAGPYWYGYSVAAWDGDTLVVRALGLDDRAWMDEWGVQFGPDARFEERWRRVGPDQIRMTVTVTDPAYFTRPWTSTTLTYHRQKKDVEPQEIIFAPIDEEAFNETIRDPAGLPKK